ncbi:hypothetical protein KBC79_00010 [Candidatus Woesebacteria bacterium]|nr:hypothetical protein [Candidatus Woesebacteria bacterium]
MTSQILDLENRLTQIEERNQRVELDKAWEGSYTRRFLIVLFTFISIGGYMWIIGVDKPLINAVIPSLGFTLSTLSLPFWKRKWIEKNQKRTNL